MIRLEELTPDAHVEGIEPAQTVTVVQVKAVGADALQVVYKRSDGSISEPSLPTYVRHGVPKELE